MGRRLRTLRSWFGGLDFGSHGHAATEPLLLINGFVALAVGFAVWMRSRSHGLGAGAAAATFVGLVACLLSRRAAPVAAALGSLAAASVAGAIGWGFGGTSTVVSVLLGGAFGGGALVGTFWMYMRFVRDTTGAGRLEGRFAGTFVHRTDKRAPERGAATVVVAAAAGGAEDLRISGLTIEGAAIDVYGNRKEGDEVAELTRAADLTRSPEAPFDLWYGRATIHDGGTLIVDLGGPFGGFIFTGTRAG